MATLDKLYYVNVGPGGTFKPSGKPEYDTTPADVDAIFNYLTTQQKKKLVLYFHGGAVNENTGMVIAERIKNLITGNCDVHPISFVWETGFFKTIIDNLTDIHGNGLFKKLLEKAAKIAGSRLGINLDSDAGIRGVGNLSDEEIKAELAKPLPFEKYQVDIRARSANIPEGIPDYLLQNEIEAQLDEEFESDQEFQMVIKEEKSPEELRHLEIEKLTEVPSDGSRGIIQWIKAVKAIGTIIFRIVKRHLNKRDHGFFPTLTEEILRELYLADFGSWVIGGMKEKAFDMWKEDDNGATSLDQIHAGNYFLKKLKEFVNSNPDTTIDLCGVSLGSVVICHFVDKIASSAPEIKVRNIILVAPACRCELFYESILKKPQTFSSIRIFTMLDENEIKDRLVPVIYTRSILYLISGALEDRGESYDAFILGLQRHISNKVPYQSEIVLKKIHEFLSESNDRAVYAVTDSGANEGFKTSALKHTAFDEDTDTLNSILYIVKQ